MLPKSTDDSEQMRAVEARDHAANRGGVAAAILAFLVAVIASALAVYNGYAPAIGVAAAMAVLSGFLMRRLLVLPAKSLDHHESPETTAAPGEVASPAALFEDRVRVALARSSRAGERLTVLALAVDQHEECKLAFGDAIVPVLEQEVLSRAASATREEEAPLWVSENRYMMVLGHSSSEASSAVIERLRDRFVPLLNIAGERVAATLSIGVAQDSDGIMQAGGLIRAAEVALADARGQGGDRVVHYRHELDDIAFARATIARDFRNALGRDRELALVFQPTFTLGTGAITGAEALLRWNHEIHGRLSAPFLITLAQEAGLNERLGRWTLSTGLAAATGAGLARLTFNVSIGQLQSEAVVSQLLSSVGNGSANPTELEVDFPLAALEADEASLALIRLADAGISLCVDGLGSAPLAACSWLAEWQARHKVKFDKVKIDLHTFPGFAISRQDQIELGLSVTRLSAMGAVVAAKNVENGEQYRLLAGAGFGEAQGNYLCAPVTASTLSRLTSDPGAIGIGEAI